MRTRTDQSSDEFKKVPIFTATKSLDVKYTFNYGKHESAFTTVMGANIHAELYAGFDGLITTRRSMVAGTGRALYPKSIDSVNIATAALTVLYTDTSTEEGYLGEEVHQKTFFITAEGHAGSILSSHDFYTEEKAQRNVTSSKAARDATFNHLLTQRINAFSSVSLRYDLPSNAISMQSELQKSIDGPMFHETFHHSEQALMHYMSAEKGLAGLVNNVVTTGAVYLYGMTLDIFTQRMLCCNCNVSLLGMQSSHQAGFIHDFSDALKGKRVQPAEGGVMLDVRASAKKAAKASATMEVLTLPTDAQVVHQYNPRENIPRILQAENKTLGTGKIINDKKLTLASCKSTFFVSSTFSKKKLEERIQYIRKPGPA